MFKAHKIAAASQGLWDAAERLGSSVERANAMSAAWDDMAASAMRFDGSYEVARDRFNAVSQSMEEGQ